MNNSYSTSLQPGQQLLLQTSTEELPPHRHSHEVANTAEGELPNVSPSGNNEEESVEKSDVDSDAN